METKYGFKKMNLEEFKTYIDDLWVARTVLTVQQHHTYSPSYKHFGTSDHFTLQRNMKNYHVNNRGWSDIGQHFTTFPDGTVLTGRSMERNPAGIYGANTSSICIEHLGNFDIEGDEMTDEHREMVVGITGVLCGRFKVPVNSDKVIYHHWYKLSTGKRNNGEGGNKSCPGTNFFGGNKVEDCKTNFLPLVKASMEGGVVSNGSDTSTAGGAGTGSSSGSVSSSSSTSSGGSSASATATTGNGATLNEGDADLLKYVVVTASKLNIRTGPGTPFALVSDREPTVMGSVLRVYEEKDGWYRITQTDDHYIYARYTKEVRRAMVLVNNLNVRSGPGDDFEILTSFKKGTEIFIEKNSDYWGCLAVENRWLHTGYLEFMD